MHKPTARLASYLAAIALLAAWSPPASAQWAPDGVALTAPLPAVVNLKIVSDGSGGAIFTWEGQRDTLNGDIYAQRLDAFGARQWGNYGVAVCAEVTSQRRPELTGDGSGGAIVAWVHSLYVSDWPGVHAQHVGADGIIRWPAGWVVLVEDAFSSSPTIVSSAPSTAIVTWPDRRGSTQDIYAQRAADPEPGYGYCFGDPGSGTPCPCSNDNDGSVAGAGCANGTHASGARLSASGEASLAGDSLVLAVSSAVPIELGLFFQADDDLSPGHAWGDGLRCAGGNLKRLQGQPANDRGSSATTLVISAHAGNIQPGSTKYYQVWYRDPPGSPCGRQFNTTNGYAVTWSQ